VRSSPSPRIFVAEIGAGYFQETHPETLSRVQPLLRADLQRQPDARTLSRDPAAVATRRVVVSSRESPAARATRRPQGSACCRRDGRTPTADLERLAALLDGKSRVTVLALGMRGAHDEFAALASG